VLAPVRSKTTKNELREERADRQNDGGLYQSNVAKARALAATAVSIPLTICTTHERVMAIPRAFADDDANQYRG
jgi:hypothetical protein